MVNIPKIIYIALSIMLASLPMAMAADMREAYRPAGQAFPQIIQDDDYATIVAIETLYVEISKIGKDLKAHKPQVDLLIQKSIKGSKNKKTVTLFTTLNKILSDLSAKNKCAGLRIEQFPTNAYKKRTVIDFDCGANIVALDSSSNGPNNEERLYTLDIVNRKESFAYAH